MALDIAAANGFARIETTFESDHPTDRPIRTMWQKLKPRIKTRPSPEFFEHDNRKLPQGWSKDSFEFEGLKIPYHIARATQENAVVACVSGLKPDHAVSKKIVKAYKKRGVSVVWINLPNPGRSLGYMPFYKRLAHYFYTSQNSPLNTEFDEGLTRLAQAHSTGASILTDLSTDEKTKPDYAHFKFILPEATFIDNANAAEHDNFFFRHLFTAYASWHKFKLPHETVGGLTYLNIAALKHKVRGSRPTEEASRISRISYDAAFTLYIATQTIKEKLASCIIDGQPNLIRRLSSPLMMAAHNGIENITEAAGLPSPKSFSNKDYLTEFGTPTYGQILETRRPGRKTYHRILNDPHASPAAPMLFVLGNHDPFSSDVPQIKIAKHLKMPFYIANAQHKPLSEDKAARKLAIKIIEHAVPDVQKLPKEIRATEEDTSRDFWPDFSRISISKAKLGERFASAVSSMPRPSLDRLRPRMQSLFSRTP